MLTWLHGKITLKLLTMPLIKTIFGKFSLLIIFSKPTYQYKFSNHSTFCSNFSTELTCKPHFIPTYTEVQLGR